jgi:hypothetical protein
MKKVLGIFCALAALITAFPLSALETDNYLSWTINLDDSASVINTYINQEIELELKQQKTKKVESCQAMTLKIAKRFKTKPPVTHPLEDYLADHLTDAMIFPKESNYRLRSIYQNPFRFYLKYVKLAPTVQVNGVYLGTDKLSHFVSTGRRYYSYYNKQLKKGLRPQEALEKTIRFGLWNEKTFLGSWSSGVFSYADMEANYQGLLFYQSFCDSNQTQPLLTLSPERKWTQVRPFDIRSYISPYWDETFNPSYRLKRNWKKTSKTLKKHYCELAQSSRVQERFQTYQEYFDLWPQDRTSLEYIAQLQEQEHRLAPDPLRQQSFELLCR